MDFPNRSGKRAAIARAIALVLICGLALALIAPQAAVLAQTPTVDAPLRQAWQAVFPAEGAVRAVLADAAAVYALTDEGIVHALATDDGRELWRTSGWLVPEAARCPYDPPKIHSVTYSGYYRQNNLYLTADGDVLIAALCAGWANYQMDQQLLLLDKATGDLRSTMSVFGGRLVGVDAGVAVVSDADGVRAVSLASQHELWQAVGEDDYDVPGFQGMSAGVVLTRLYLDNQPMLTARAIADGTVLWEMPVDSDDYLIAGDDLILLARSHGSGDKVELQALDPRTGAIRWTSDLSGFAGSLYWLETVVQGGDIYAYLNGLPPGRIATLRADSGAPLWNVEVPFAVQKVNPLGELVYCMGLADDSTESRLHALAGEDGHEVWDGLPGGRLLLVSPSGGLLVTSVEAGVSVSDAVVTAYQSR